MLNQRKENKNKTYILIEAYEIITGQHILARVLSIFLLDRM